MRVTGSAVGRAAAAAALVATGSIVTAPMAPASQTRLWTGSPAHLQRGDADGVAVTSNGELFLAPRLTPLGSTDPMTREAHVWSIAADDLGNVYLGTGPDGRVLKISPSGVETES